MATANPNESEGARSAEAAGDRQSQPKPHVFQYAITPTRWPGPDPTVMTEWRENVFLQLGARAAHVGSAEVKARPEVAEQVLASEEGGEHSPSHEAAGRGREASGDVSEGERAAAEGEGVDSASPPEVQRSTGEVPRPRRRRHEAVDPALLLPAAAKRSAQEAAKAEERGDHADSVGALENACNNDLEEVPPGVLTPAQIVRGDPLRLPDEDTRRKGKRVQATPRRGGMVAMEPETVSVTPAPESSPKSRETGVIVDVEATETTPVQPARKGFRHWRRTRPFTAGLLSMLGGAIVAAGPVSLLHVVAFSQSSVPIGAAVGILIFIMGLLEWVFPFYAMLTGSITVVLALVSLVVASFGGLFVGMLLSLVGGAMAVAWRPVQPKKQKNAKPKAPNLPNTPSASA